MYLYQYIRKNKPIEILECGTGVSTLIMTTALKELESEGYEVGKITSMDSHKEYLEMSRDLLPENLEKYVDFHLSDVMEDFFSIYRGVRYSDIPNREYDFAFIGGPDYKAPSDGMLTFDFDFLYVLLRSKNPLAGMVDKRVSTCYVLQQLLGIDRVKYEPVSHLGFIKPSTKSNLLTIDTVTPSLTSSDSYRVIIPTKLIYSRKFP
ncbi:MAG: hypothetical protein ACJAV1_002262 [Paraglaciecola sp.]